MIILNLDVKKTMSALLLSETFDGFRFTEGEITTFNTFHIDGYLQKTFYDQDHLPEYLSSRDYSLWKDLKDFCFQIIKGKQTPLSFHFVFSLDTPDLSRLLEPSSFSGSSEDIQGLYLNFKYDRTTLTCTTGTSLKVFTLDKSLDHLWDNHVQSFFTTLDLISPL